MRQPAPPPFAPGRHRLFGHLRAVASDHLPFLRAAADTGPVQRLRMGPVTAYLVTEPSLIRQVTLDASTYRGGRIAKGLHHLVGDATITLDGQAHRTRRRHLQQTTFRPEHVERYRAICATKAASRCAAWTPDAPLDIVDEMLRLCIDTLITSVDAERDTPPASIAELAAATTIISQGLQLRIALPRLAPHLPIRGRLRYPRAVHRVHDEIAAIRAARAVGHDTRTELPAQRQDAHAAHAALRSCGRATDTLSPNEVCDELADIVAGGVEAPALLCAWALHEVALRRDVERRLHDEVDTRLAGRGAQPGDLPHLPYSRSIVMETLRRRPAFPLIGREPVTDTCLDGFRIPRGRPVLLSIYSAHHQTRWYPDPEHFDPERWLAGRVPQPPRQAFLPFGAGAHHCPASTLAPDLATLVLATVASRHRLRHLEGILPRAVGGFTLRPEPLIMTSRPRARRPDAPQGARHTDRTFPV
ncbi:cytochrome P450 [Streptomyces stramineus]|uniref:Cytochrome P450 n=1 Tax=Streptomyces stramineus TaxID=173861 RepID=A0ABN0ZPG1_9ACTN